MAHRGMRAIGAGRRHAGAYRSAGRGEGWGRGVGRVGGVALLWLAAVACEGSDWEDDEEGSGSGSWGPAPAPVYHCGAEHGAAVCLAGWPSEGEDGRIYHTEDCGNECSMYKCTGRGSDIQCIPDPFGTYATRTDCKNGCHLYRCDGSQCIPDDLHGTYFADDCEDKCHNYQCEHDTNDTKQCVENDESGRYPDGTCGSACSPTPPPPKGDWKQCGACGCRGTDLSFLQNSTIHAHDTACDRKGPEGVCHVYAFRLCGPIPMSELLNDDKLRGCREWAEGPSAENVSLLRYSETDENFCEPFTVCGAGDSGTSSECPLWGRKDKGGIGLELELRFQANAEGMKCSSNPNSSMTITFVMTKGEQPNPQRVYDNSSKDDGTSCEWVARWAGLPENPRPELDIAHENSLYGDIAAVAALGIAAVAILGVCHTMLGRGHKVQSGGRPSEAFADWTPSTERATSDSVASLDSYVTGTGTGSSMSEHLLSARHRDVDSSVDADGHVRNGGSIQ